AVVTERVQRGNCFAPMHWNDVYGDELCINAVTNDAIDPESQQPELKYCAVALRRVETDAFASADEAAAHPDAAPTTRIRSRRWCRRLLHRNPTWQTSTLSRRRSAWPISRRRR